MCLPELLTSENVNSFGLTLDIIGVWLLFYYRAKVDDIKNPVGNEMFGISGSFVASESGKKRDRLSKWSLSLIIVGFVLQIASNYIG